MEKHGFDVETFYDRKGEADAVYGVKATSTVIVVNKAGKIVYAGAGGDQDIEAAIKLGVEIVRLEIALTPPPISNLQSPVSNLHSLFVGGPPDRAT
jgi:hypothetical protein